MTPTQSDIATINDPGAHALILAGGSGTRLWPLSRALLPKQLLALNGEGSLLQQSIARALSVFAPDNVSVVTNEEHVFEVRKQIKSLDHATLPEEADIGVLAEPTGRNTLPAVLLGLDRILADANIEASEGGEDRLKDHVVAVFPSDHMVKNQAEWSRALKLGLDLARQGWTVTFGVSPTHPETGYGYITRAEALGEDAWRVAGFHEKPGLDTAKRFLDEGTYYWNSGMFIFRADVLLEAVRRLRPELAAWWEARGHTPLADGYQTLPDISVDYGVMEHLDHIAMVRADFGWDDLGSWEALYRLGDKNEKSCVVQGDVLDLDCENSLLYSRGCKLAAVGLSNMIVVQTHDATLVCPIDQVQRVKDVVNSLKSEGSNLVEAHVTVHRPWGSYTVLEEGPHYKIKRIMVLPGARLSLQMHHHRSEHWVVIAGTAMVQVDEEERLYSENQSIDIPKTSKHRLSNPGRVPLEIIEIQSGPYLEEDDIVRFEDIYNRGQMRSGH